MEEVLIGKGMKGAGERRCPESSAKALLRKVFKIIALNSLHGYLRAPHSWAIGVGISFTLVIKCCCIDQIFRNQAKVF